MSRKKMIRVIIKRYNDNIKWEGRNVPLETPKNWNKCSTRVLRECL